MKPSRRYWVAACVMALAEWMYAQSAAQKPTARAPQQSPTHFSAHPFNSAATALPANYHGHDPEAIYKALESWSNTAKKGEFETTAEYRQRLAQRPAPSLPQGQSIQDLFAFELSPGKYSFVYDADAALMSVRFDFDGGSISIDDLPEAARPRSPSLEERLEGVRLPTADLVLQAQEVTTYVGDNAFGSQRQIKKLRATSYGIACSNCESLSKQEGVRKSVRWQVSMAPAKARVSKPNSRVLLVVRLQDPFALSGASQTQRPTRDMPIDLIEDKKYLWAQIVEIVTYDFTSGEILHRFGPEAKSGGTPTSLGGAGAVSLKPGPLQGEDSDVVYVMVGGVVYHRRDCISLSGLKVVTKKLSELGPSSVACSQCDPPPNPNKVR